MTIYHTSPEKIETISDSGRFGEFLFFANEPYTMAACKVITYRLDYVPNLIDAADIFFEDDSDLKCKELILRVSEMVGCDEGTASDLIDESKSLWDLECGIADADKAEISWDIQHISALAAQALGYEGVVLEDEQGPAYLVNMSDKIELMLLDN